jgi:hypothetical protein
MDMNFRQTPNKRLWKRRIPILLWRVLSLPPNPLALRSKRFVVYKNQQNSFTIVLSTNRTIRIFGATTLAAICPAIQIPPNEILESFSGQLKSFDDTCERAVKDLVSSPMTATPPPNGADWNIWVWRLTKIVQDFGLPQGVRNDSDKQLTENTLEFVSLMIELQSEIPEQFRRPYASSHALAKAIHRAREDCERDTTAASPSKKKSRKSHSEST